MGGLVDGAGGGVIDLIGVGWSCVWDWGWVAARGGGGGGGVGKGVIRKGGWRIARFYRERGRMLDRVCKVEGEGLGPKA